MDTSELPTKSNLINQIKSLEITSQGHELLERKRLILAREIEKYLKQKKDLYDEIFKLMEEGKELVKKVNIDIGLDNFINISNGVKIDDYIDIKNISLMCCEISSAVHKPEVVKRNYSFFNTTSSVDKVILKFNYIQEKLIEFSIVDSTIFRLNKEIKKVQKRANALKNIIIPESKRKIKKISEQIDERERDEFARLKVVKKRINN